MNAMNENYLPVKKGVIPQARDNYSAFLVVMNPYDFLLLTTEDQNNIFQIKKDDFASIADYKSEAHPIYNKQNYNLPYLGVEYASGKVLSHEGRHRAAMILKENGKKFPCLINFYNLSCFITSYTIYDEQDRPTTNKKSFQSKQAAYDFKKALEKLNDEHDDPIYENIKVNYEVGSKMKGSPRSIGWDYDAWKVSDFPPKLIGQFNRSLVIPTSNMKIGLVKGYR